jgi:K+-transporting ATPase A subunit
MKKYTLKFLLSVLVIVPVVSFAATSGNAQSFLIATRSIVNLLLPISVAVALLYFFWGVAQSILHSSEEDARKEGRQKMLWGVVAMFVIFCIYGIISFLGSNFGLTVNNASSYGSSAPLH